MDKNKINKARALYYNLFANFFVVPTDTSSYLEFIALIKFLQQNSLDNTSSESLKKILDMLDSSCNVVLMQEFDEIFNAPNSKNIQLSASFYDEGVQSGKKRLEMINFVAKTALRRDEKNFFEYEDSVGFIFAFLAQLCDELAGGKSEYENTVHCVFAEILNDFIDELAKDVFEHKSSFIYKEVMVVLHSFIEFERLFLGVSKPAVKTKVDKKEKTESISEEEKQRRARNKELKKQGPKKEDDYNLFDVHYDVETDI